MVTTTTDSDMMSQGEPDSPTNVPRPPNPQSIGRQLSIYSLTIDEFQNAFSDTNGGKGFGSMNMDEFINSIWNAEENQNQNRTAQPQFLETVIQIPSSDAYPSSHLAANNHVTIAKQPSIPRQGSFTIPEPLCRKTVEEVWSEIQKDRCSSSNNTTTTTTTTTHAPQKQPTFGEMTLEDFLVRAGVVREQQNFAAPPLSALSPYAIYHKNANTNNSPVITPNFVATPIPVIPGANYHQGYVGGMKSSAATGTGISYPGRMGNSTGGNLGSPASPVEEGQYSGGGVESRGSGRKRNGEGPVEKVVERRQRRMIKNRESAARSRARKQAYTVELEAELNQLREENSHLKQALVESERRRRQQCSEDTTTEDDDGDGGGGGVEGEG